MSLSKKRTLKVILIIAAILFSSLFAVSLFLLGSENGMGLLVNRAKPFIPGTLQIQEMEGALLKGFNLTRMHYTHGDIEAEIGRFEFEWQPSALLEGRLAIELFRARDIRLHLPQSEEKEHDASSSKLEIPSISLPLRVELSSAQIERLTLQVGENSPIHLNEMELQLVAKDELQLTITLDAPLLTADMEGALGMVSPHAVALNLEWQGKLPPEILPEITGDLRHGSGRGTLTGNMERLHFSHHLGRPLNIDIEAQANTPLEDLTWQLSFDIPNEWHVPDELVSVSGITLLPTAIQAKGNLETFSIGMKSAMNGGDEEIIPSIEYIIDAHGDLLGMDIDRFQVRMLEGEINGSGDLNWKDGLKASVKWSGTGFNFISLWPDWPKELFLSHQLQLDFFDQQLSINSLHLALLHTGELSQAQVEDQPDLLLESQSKGRFDLNGTIFLQPETTWDIDVIGSKIDPGAIFSLWPGLLDMALHSRGKIGEKGIQSEVQLENVAGTLRGYPFQADSRFSMEGDEFNIENFNLHAGDAVLNAKARLVGALKELDAQWHLSVPHLGALYPQAEGKLFSKGKVSGKIHKPMLDIELDGDALSFESFKLAKVTLDAAFIPVTSSPEKIKNDDNTIINDNDKIDFTFSAQNLTQDQTVLLKHLSLNTNGTIGRHRLQLDLERPEEQVVLLMDGRYTMEHPEAYQFELQQLDAKTALGGSWQLHHPSSVWIEADKALTGIASLVVDDICLEQRESNVCINAKWDGKKRLDAQWSLALSQLNDLLPQAAGRVSSQGKISGNITNPMLNLQLNGDELRFDDIELDTISLAATFTPKRTQQMSDADEIELSVSTGNLMQGETPIWNRLSLNTQGSMSNHHWLVDLKRSQEALNLQLDGAYFVKSPHLYRLAVKKMDTQIDMIGEWKLQRQSDITIRMNRDPARVESVVASPFCLGQGRAGICMEGEWEGKEGSRLSLNLNQLPLSLTDPFLPEDVHFKGELTGKVGAELTSRGDAKGDVEFQFSPGSITIPLEDEPHVFPIRKSRVTLQLDPRQGLHTKLNLRLLTDSYVNVDVRLPNQTGVSFTSAQSIQGQIDGKFSDLQVLSALVDVVEKSTGKMTLRAEIDGALNQPRITGELVGSGLSADVPDLGIRINRFDLNAHADGANKIDIQSKLTSGGGHINTTGRITLGDKESWQANMTIKGDAFEVINIPDVTAVISPDITLSANPEKISLQGEVVIPKADITPNVVISGEKSGAGMIHESDDVVIVNPVNTPSDTVTDGRLEDNGYTGTKRSKPMDMDFAVDIILGPKVNVDVVDFKSRLGGAVGLKLRTGQTMPRGTGEVQIIDGTYRAYGQDLEIPKGRILFTGGDVTNPGLNITAFRSIEQDKSTNNVTEAGVQITGRVQNPHLRLYSNPMTESAHIISYIVTGSALTGERSSLSLGTYLTPKLYISAGVSLFDQSKEFNLRYDLNRKWGVEASLGDLDSGVDISYTIGR